MNFAVCLTRLGHPQVVTVDGEELDKLLGEGMVEILPLVDKRVILRYLADRPWEEVEEPQKRLPAPPAVPKDGEPKTPVTHVLPTQPMTTTEMHEAVADASLAVGNRRKTIVIKSDDIPDEPA